METFGDIHLMFQPCFQLLHPASFFSRRSGQQARAWRDFLTKHFVDKYVGFCWVNLPTNSEVILRAYWFEASVTLCYLAEEICKIDTFESLIPKPKSDLQ
ncbi:uncharacterized protein TrAtP1_003700 [Trichoderma atroviride]|uniref:Uncharacterized protein n=1 Tax=Hypocrea atroviridis (strain ATCC 20476 / IMI 206040) TaxID=452589 RepID=G9NWP9_HYPAI|nr:uncharacterized protein TRIATDRAFT_300044 [Trichoderma atroviride IMI 206040]EHK45400.1 hypothetical protein TRIATDRAFT_300044 [Trichoderma atroviride IMI 206040]UKZ62451.1 hypothetical protein TrAtP1_003700 [Trichoderma atroviride]